MAQQQTESLSDVNNSEDMTKNCSSNMQNGTDPSSNAGRNSQQQQQSQQQQINSRSMQQIQGMSDKANTKSPSGQGGIMHSGGGAPNNGGGGVGGGDSQSNPYGAEQHSMVHYPLPMQHNANDNPNKDDPYGPQAGGVSHPYSRFHHDPNTPPDPFARYHPPIQPGKPPGILPPNRPPQRFIPGQSPQGPTPTLNSLLQSHPPPPPQHRYPSSYDPQQQSSQQQPTPQSFSPQQSWAPPPRPYSPQLGASQTYRTPPPTNASRGQSPYPPPGQNSGSYPPSPQQGGPPPPQNQGPATSQYSPYPQRYPTPPAPAGGPNHRSPYPTHQYPEPNRPWPSGPGGPSPAASPGPGGHPHPPASPHQTQHGGPPPSSPGHAPSPSPQPPQASPSPHQELIGQNSNDSSSGGISGVGSGPPGTPNPQQAMRPTPSPTSSSGSRSMSPAVGQQSLSMPPRPSSSQPQAGATQLPPTTSGMISSHGSLVNTQQQQQQHHQQQQQQQQHLQSAQHQPPPPSDFSSGSTQRSHNSNTSQQPPTSLSSHQQQQQQSGPTSNSMAAQGSNYQSAPPPISHMHGYKMGPSPGQGSGPNPQSMPPYPPPQSQQYSQGNYPPRPQYPSGYGPTPQAGQPPPANSMTPSGQYTNRPLPNHVGGPHSQFPPYQQGWAPPSPQTPTVMSNHVQGKGTPPPSQTNVGSPRPLNYLKQHLQHKGGYVGAPSPTPPQGYGNGPGMHLPMGPPHHMGPPPGPTNMGPPTSAPQNTPPIPSAPAGTNNNSDGSSTPDHNSVSQDNGVSSSGSSTTSLHPVTSVITTGPDGAPLDEASQQSTLSNASAASGEDPQCVTPKSRKSESYSQSHLIPPNASPGAHPHGDDFEMNSPSTWPRTAASPVFNSHVPQETYRASPKVNFSKKSDSLCKLYDMDDNPERRVWLDKLLHFMEERRTPITACPTISKQPLDLYRLYLLVKERGGFVEVCKVTKSKTWKDIAGLLGIGASSSAAYTLRKHYTKNLLAFECHFDRGDIDPLPIIQQVEAGSKKKATKAASVPSPGSGTKAGSSNSQDSFPPTGSTSTSMDGYPAYPSNYPAAAQQEYNAPPQMQRPPSQNNAQTPHTGTPYQGQASYNQFGGTDQYSSAAPPGQYSQTQSQFPPPNRTMYPPYAPEGEPSVPATSSSYAPYAPSSRPYSQPPTAATQPQTSTAAPAPQGTPVAYPPPPPQQDYYRPTEQTPQPRRHPDFAKESQPYTGYGQRPQVYGGWQNSSGQYRAQYPAQAGTQQWPSGTRPPVPPAPAQPTSQWDQHRYPSQAQQPYPAATQQQWGNMSAPSATNASAALRPPPQRSSGKPFNMPPPQTANKTVPQQQQPQSIFGPVGQAPKRDIVFPTDSVEATTPVLYRRKKYTKTDVCPVDPWRIFMALRSGLLSESTWALDILNILLFDDTAVHYFGLQHLPGLLNLLLAHFQKNLSDMFDTGADKKRNYGWNSQDDESEQADEVDLGQVTNTPNPEERVMLLTSTPNYTMVSRKGVPVRIQNAEEDIFVSELPKRWDHETNKNYQLSAPVGSDPWTYGHLEPHPHDGIIDVFKAEIVDIPFARYLKSDKKDKLERELEDDDLEGDDSYCELRKGRERGLFVNRKNKRRLNSKNGWTEATKRAKLKECLLENRNLVNKGADTCLEEKMKKEPVDSDCREVDMEIEQPRIFNGPQLEESEHKLSLGKQPLDRDNNIKKEGKNEGSSEAQFDPKETVRDPSLILKRRRMSEYEDECYTRDEASLYLVNESQDTLARRCICLSNIFRNLTFVPGNETVLAKSPTFLAILGKVLLLNHEHLVRTQKTRNYDREEDTDFADSCSSLQGENEWWWDYLIQIRENMLVAMANIAGHLELSRYEEIITRPVLDGLLHWAVCPSAHGQDPFPSCGPNTSLSPQRLALEALCKLCVTDANVDLVIATPPFSRLEKLCSVLTRHLCRNEDQVLREFSVNLLHYLAAADSAMSRTVALQSPCISYLVAFIEQAEQTALGVANQHGINYLRENPDSMGTSLDMLRRAAGTLLHLSKHSDNRPLFMQQEQRLLGLVMSHILDQQVALIISRVLFQISRSAGNANSSEYKSQQRRLNKKTAELQQQQLLTTLQSEDSSSIALQTLSLSSQLKLENSGASVTCSSGGGGANSNSSFAGTASTNSNSSSAGSPGSASSKGDETSIPTNLNFGSSSIGGGSSPNEGGGSSGGGSNKSNNISTTVITNSNNSSSATPTTAAVA